jgi:hypothetical protein
MLVHEALKLLVYLEQASKKLAGKRANFPESSVEQGTTCVGSEKKELLTVKWAQTNPF